MGAFAPAEQGSPRAGRRARRRRAAKKKKRTGEIYEPPPYRGRGRGSGPVAFSLVVRDEPSPLGPPGAACPAVVYGLQFSLAGTNRLAPAFLAAVGASWGVVGALAPLWWWWVLRAQVKETVSVALFVIVIALEV